jgi:hypothetical protein
VKIRTEEYGEERECEGKQVMLEGTRKVEGDEME